MPVSYTNRKGQTYFLCQRVTKTGKSRYFFAKNSWQNVLEEIPDGYHIEESVNGVVSLVKNRPQLILPEEVQLVETALQRHPKGNNYRVSVKGEQITIHERVGPDAETIAKIFEGTVSPLSRKDILDRTHTILDKKARFSPILRFALVNVETRNFCAERVTYMTSRPGWINISDCGPLQTLVDEIITLLDTDEYFELL